MHDAQYWIDALKLEPHPEGGYFREMYRSPLSISQSALPNSFAGDRSVSTAIYFLLQGADFSAFHRIASDEMWHFYAGDPLSVHAIDSDGQSIEIKLGPDPERGEVFQAVRSGRMLVWFLPRTIGHICAGGLYRCSRI